MENYKFYCNARRDVKNGVRSAKKDMEIKIARLSKSNPKLFSNMCRVALNQKRRYQI